MTIIRSLAIGKARKSMGSLTYTTVGDRTIVREKQETGVFAETPARLAHRQRRQNLVDAWRFFFQSYSYLFTNLKTFMSPYTMFMKLNAPFSNNPWVTNNVWDGVPSGAFASSGVYTVNDAFLFRSSASLMGMRFRSKDLIDNLQVGDQIILFRQQSASVFNILVTVWSLTASEILSIRNTGQFTRTITFSVANIAGIYYSPSRQKNSTAIFRNVPVE